MQKASVAENKFCVFKSICALACDSRQSKQLANKSRRRVPKDQKFISPKKLVNVHGASY